MKILVVGHSLVVDSNRKFWSVMAGTQNTEVTLILPEKWNSNLVNEVSYTLNPEIDKNIKNAPIPVYFKGNGSLYFYHLIKFFKLLNSTKFDAIIVTQETWSFSALQLGVLKTFTKNRRTNAYLSLCQNIKKEKLKFAHPLERFITSFYKKIFYCETAICDVLTWKKINNPTAYWPFSFDGELYHKTVSQLETQKTLRLGYIGRLSEEKGIDTLLTAFEKLKKEMPIELTVAGNGPLKDKMSGDGIKFLGTIPHNKAHLFYQDVDIIILPSKTTTFWKEQFGRVIIEAVASGKPVIGSTSGAIPEVLSHIGIKNIFHEGNAEALAEQIRLLSNQMKKNEWPQIFDEYYKNNQQFSHASVAKKLFAEIQ
jgi:glycosyltransferase involved in cell wall biosynthesis